MADFCKQCSIELFKKDFEDMKGLITKEEVASGLGVQVLCEGCGFTMVDHEGKCINKWCEKHGSEKDG